MARLIPAVCALLLTACGTEPAPDVPYDIAPSCTLDRMDSGWSLDGTLASPRLGDPVGATYPAFALFEQQRSIEDVRDRARRIGEVLLGRAIAPDEVSLDAESSTAKMWSFTSAALGATYRPEEDELRVEARVAFPETGPDIPAIGADDAFHRFRCAHDRLRLAGLLEEASYPAQYARLGMIRAAQSDGSGVYAHWIESLSFDARRYVDDVLAPGWVEVESHPSGALKRITLATPKLFEHSSVARASTWDELEQRLRMDADAVAPGRTVTIHSAPLSYERVELPGGATLAPVQTFAFSIDGLMTRGGLVWSYRIDDPSAPKRDHAQDP